MNSKRLGQHAQVLYGLVPNWIIELKVEVDIWPHLLGSVAIQYFMVEELFKGYSFQLNHKTSEYIGPWGPVSPLRSYPF